MSRILPTMGAPRALALMLGLLAAGALIPGPSSAQTADEVQPVCASCHTRADIGSIRAYVHGEFSTCLTCHHIGFSNDPAVVAERRLDACQECHGPMTGLHSGAHGEAAVCTDCHSIHADPEDVGPSLVADAACQSCHAGEQHTLHADVADGPGCTSCHEVHGNPSAVLSETAMDGRCETCHETSHPSHEAVAGGLPCLECHGVDAVTPVAEDPVTLSGECQSCHEAMQPTHEVDGEDMLMCTDCHDFGETTGALLSGPAVSQRCGECHDELDAMEAGGHAQGVTAHGANTDMPNCTTCHTAHANPDSREADLRLSATLQCIECHSDGTLIERYDLPANAVASYLDDYHGATLEFMSNHPSGKDQPNVLVCSDCHGAHAVGWDPSTAMSGVCLECHEKGDQKLAGAWIGHAQVGPRNKILVWMIRLFYWVLIPFVLGGLFFNIILHLRRERRHGARMGRTPKMTRIRARLSGNRPPKPATVTRFNKLERVEHLAAMTTFIMLVVTGLPQTAPTADWANDMIHFFGGIGTTRLIHRITGFSFVALLVLHITRGVRGILRRRQLPEIVPTRQDFLNLIQTARHFLLGTPKPKNGKFDAAAKFEYWGLFFGGMIMTVTGLALVFPELVTRLLPGQVVAMLRTMHGLEATFAVSVVALWHSWSVIFRPDVFPLDASMFTGEMEVERLKEEHALEYERLAAEGGLPEAE